MVFAGMWQDMWKRDFPDGSSAKTKMVLSLYEDAAADARALLDHQGVYCEVTIDDPVTARNRAMKAGFGDVVVSSDSEQRYLWCRKVGRPQ